MAKAGRPTIRAGTPLLLFGALLAAGVATPAEHPTLVSVESADCTVCHEDLLEGRETVHAPVADDCTACHEFEQADDRTQVALMEAEPALCLFCHDMTAEVEGDVATPHFPVTDSCLTCHDPHAAEQRRLLLAPTAEVCAACHDPADLEQPHGGQLTPASDCARCHQPHGSSNDSMLISRHLHRPFADGSCKGCHRAPFGDRIRLRSRGERLCHACHSDLKDPAPEGGSAHAALRGEKGRAGCLSCHDPHMSQQSRLLVRPGAELCATCHGSIFEAAVAETGHPPAAEDCVTCHLPHTSAEARLLNAPALEICGMCHDVEDTDLSQAHLGADLSALNCLACHTPHGSGHEKLLAANLHAPVLDGCETCHEGGYDELMDGGESSLCLICHDDIGETAATAEFPHGALELARCADCHNPHASPQRHLVKSPGGTVCLECHDDKAPGQGEAAHSVIDEVGCQVCHEPHGGSAAKLLRADGSDLCLACHDASLLAGADENGTIRVMERYEFSVERAAEMASLRLSPDGTQGHPVVGHRVRGRPTEEELTKTMTTFEGELSCFTCHDPHKGRKSLLQWDASGPVEACLQCHPK